MKYVIIIAVLLLLCYVLDGGLKRKRILNADQAKEGAVITELEQKKCGSGKDAHIELTVHFSDGTTYCDDCTKERRGFTKKTYWYDKEKEPIIISKAEAAHAKAVEKNKMKTKWTGKKDRAYASISGNKLVTKAVYEPVTIHVTATATDGTKKSMKVNYIFG